MTHSTTRSKVQYKYILLKNKILLQIPSALKNNPVHLTDWQKNKLRIKKNHVNLKWFDNNTIKPLKKSRETQPQPTRKRTIEDRNHMQEWKFKKTTYSKCSKNEP